MKSYVDRVGLIFPVFLSLSRPATMGATKYGPSLSHNIYIYIYIYLLEYKVVATKLANPSAEISSFSLNLYIFVLYLNREAL